MTLTSFLAGAVCLGFALCALFFLRFWRDTRDALFLSFSAAFVLLGVGQGIFAVTGIPDEQRTWIYVLRLCAFLLLLTAILQKNRRD
ncbi:hypothetical protein SAMN03159338_4480 [Sphingomonas sp. NFR04]|uniref:DUF5985 family protein n=1 Tax=Sphingomonas sp. NFR04 TaxID=1566283 RepID=UPI0008EC8484|nr:DUF5985 family protein [Sphingomonas sp. NFR04]SFK53453.1 hypothetical protein SAMN03159338_4480 [Sphingomonas sp. NFR04]